MVAGNIKTENCNTVQRLPAKVECAQSETEIYFTSKYMATQAVTQGIIECCLQLRLGISLF